MTEKTAQAREKIPTNSRNRLMAGRTYMMRVFSKKMASPRLLATIR
jgi:hypothetical protein